MRIIITAVFLTFILITSPCRGQVKGINSSGGEITISGIEWRMHPKFNPPAIFTNETSMVEGYLRLEHKYDPNYVKAENYGVTIEAKILTGQVKHPIKYKWEIIGISKGDGTPNGYNKVYTTNKKGLFSQSATSSQTDINPPYENIETLPYDGKYKIRITPIIVSNNLEKSQKTFEATIQLKDYLIVAIGDSFTSGEGSPDIAGETDDPILCDQIKIGVIANDLLGNIGFDDEFDMKKEAVWVEPKAHRSFNSPSALLARKLEDGDPYSVITFLNFGTSGAKILKGLLTPQHPDWQSTGQIQEAKANIGNRKMDVLIMSIGINDIGVNGGGISSLIQGAAKPGNYFDAGKIDEVNLRIDNLNDRYALLNNEIERFLSPSTVCLFEVPINMFRNAGNEILGGCGALSLINQSEASQLDRFGRKLLEKMRDACNRHRWKYIGGIVAAFRGHGYCEAPANSWYRAASTSCKIQGDINGTIHPNQAGHKKIAELAYPIVSKELFKPIKTLFPGSIKTN
jgi:lysophospholipase L1-like esterase